MPYYQRIHRDGLMKQALITSTYTLTHWHRRCNAVWHRIYGSFDESIACMCVCVLALFAFARIRINFILENIFAGIPFIKHTDNIVSLWLNDVKRIYAKFNDAYKLVQITFSFYSSSDQLQFLPLPTPQFTFHRRSNFKLCIQSYMNYK